MKDAFSTDPKRDMPTERKAAVNTENDFVIKQIDNDPYGFWWISRERGQVPATLQGAYTTYPLAKAAVEQHLNAS